MYYHTTREGKKIKLADLKLSHLKNIIRWIERRAKKGVMVIRGGRGPCAEDMWCDVDTYFGSKARDELNYFAYKDEFKKRLKQSETEDEL